MNISVRLSERSYAIHLEPSYRALPALLAREQLPRYGWIISHRRLLRQHGAELLQSLRRAGWTLKTISVPESESSKSLITAQRVIQQLARQATMRVPVLFAFGGGVIGDLTGFVAATYRRGVPYVQLPTTLLAQVDSAIGGKVGVDLPQGKNLVGAFYQPRLVYNNLSVLHTLPLRQRQSGLAEVIKYGAIADPAVFRLLERQSQDALALEGRVVRYLIEHSCRIKAHVVAQDEREQGSLRAHLNFGHTLGHALEAATHYTRWTHGEAIAIGMCAAAFLSVQAGRLSSQAHARIEQVIRTFGLPTHARGVSRATVQRALRYDKKFIHGRPRWVLLTRIGRVVVTEQVPAVAVEAMLKRYVPSA